MAMSNTVSRPHPAGIAAPALPTGIIPFPSPLTSPHIVVMDADLECLERAGRLLSGHGYGITLSSTLLDDATCAFLNPDLLIVDLETVVPPSARRLAERTVLDMACREHIAVMLCQGGFRSGRGSGRPGVTAIAKPLRPDDFLPTVEALLYWRDEQQRSRARRAVSDPALAPIALDFR